MIRALAVAAVLAFPAGAAARSWSAPRRLAPSGYDPSAAIGSVTGTGVVFATHAAGRYAVVLRQGSGVLKRGAVAVLRSSHRLDSPQLAFGTGGATVAWRQLQGSWGLRARRIAGGSVVNLVRGGDSALFPFFVAGPANLIAWGRRSGAGMGSVDGTAPALPAGATTDIAAVQSADGTITAAWPLHGVLYAARGTVPGGFGPAVPISPANGFARDPQLVADGGGNVTAVWTDSHHQGNALLASVAPRGGTFGRAYQVERSTFGVTSPRATLAPDGTVLVTFVSTRRSLEVAHYPGTVRFARLDATGRRAGQVVTINPPGARATEVVASGSEVAWASGRRIYTRQLAADGSFGPAQAIRTAGEPVQVSLAANTTGRAILAYVAGGAVYAAARR